ncbi:MAG: GNAT family N-acetyltransferase [Clostridia bacterium]|nr:GNAT family N-acetyltransferase [Clostridia bacterium]
MKLRRAAQGELPLVTALYRSVIGLPGCTWDESYPDAEGTEAALLQGNLFLFFDGDEAIGSVTILSPCHFDDQPVWRVTGDRFCEISRVVIRRDRGGRGLARVMLGELVTLLRGEGCRAVRLAVSRENAAAVATYRGMGFSFLGECRKHGVDFLLCELEL